MFVYVVCTKKTKTFCAVYATRELAVAWCGKFLHLYMIYECDVCEVMPVNEVIG